MFNPRIRVSVEVQSHFQTQGRFKNVQMGFVQMRGGEGSDMLVWKGCWLQGNGTRPKSNKE